MASESIIIQFIHRPVYEINHWLSICANVLFKSLILFLEKWAKVRNWVTLRINWMLSKISTVELNWIMLNNENIEIRTWIKDRNHHEYHRVCLIKLMTSLCTKNTVPFGLSIRVTHIFCGMSYFKISIHRRYSPIKLHIKPQKLRGRCKLKNSS